MHQDVLRTRWKQVRTELTHQWKHLKSQDLDLVDGKRDNLVFLLQRQYGFARGRAEREVEIFVNEFADRLRRAS
jgi:hypothetical protein